MFNKRNSFQATIRYGLSGTSEQNLKNVLSFIRGRHDGDMGGGGGGFTPISFDQRAIRGAHICAVVL